MEWFPALGLFVLAIGLTAAAIWSIADPSQRTGNAIDDYGIWLVAAAAWIAPMSLGQGVLRRMRAYRNREPAIAVDDDGITLRGWTGKLLDLKWSEVTDLELEQRSGKSALLIRGGSVSGSVSLDDLHAHPISIWDIVKRCRERR